MASPITRRETFVAGGIIAVLLLVAVLFVGSSLRRPAVDSYAPTAPDPADVGSVLIGPVTYTLDASSTDAWAAFDFSRGSRVDVREAGGWDIAFRRFNVMTNGGDGFGGNAGVVDLGAVAFDSVLAAPATGYVLGSARRDSVNEAIDRWYDYGFTSHILRSKGHVYAIRTADGRYAKLEILSYYCPGALPGCITFRYVYQGSGTRDLIESAEPQEPPDA